MRVIALRRHGEAGIGEDLYVSACEEPRLPSVPSIGHRDRLNRHAHRGSEISDVLTIRLREQAQSVADGLWSVAARIVVADRVGSRLVRDRLAREDEMLLRLLPAMEEARAGLTELVLAGSGADQLPRCEGRFRGLAATAHDLKEFEPGPTPG
jgi:hypothetical protein